ncbi:MAG: hypothetical protein IPM23_23765 [Candidatus Melainabacteria bacterium]|nr:hypothetical protein [Candidatus Melainabacteria bacterium]
MLEYDDTDVNDLTRSEIKGRRQAILAIKALQHFAPGFEPPDRAGARSQTRSDGGLSCRIGRPERIE